LHGGLVVDGRVAHALLDLAGHGQEGLLDVAGVLGRGLEEGDAEAVCEFLFIQHISTIVAVTRATWASGWIPAEERVMTDLRHRILHHLLIRHIALVPHQQLVHALRRVAVNLLQPLLNVVEAVHIGDIVDDADAVCAAVVRGSDGAEALLPGRVPLYISISPPHASRPPTPTTSHVDYSLVRRFVRV